MNSATIKYNKIATTEGGFKGSVHSVQEDIVALFATKANSHKKRKAEDEDNPNTKFKKAKLNTPPWITHFQNNGVKYKIGDSKEFNEKNFISAMQQSIATRSSGTLTSQKYAAFAKFGSRRKQTAQQIMQSQLRQISRKRY